MHRKAPIIFGGFLILIGFSAIIKNIFGFDLWVILFPLLLIGIGVFLIMRPSLTVEGSEVIFKLLGEYRLTGSWQVRDQEIWVIIGDVDLDFRTAEIPAGISQVRLYGFVGDVRIRPPENAAIQVAADGFITSSSFQGNKQDSFLTTRYFKSPSYEESDRKVNLRTWFFVNDLKVE